MVTGKCLCATVRFELDASKVILFNNCYCQRCRYTSGTAFVSQLQVPAEHFHWLSGEDNMRVYQTSSESSRAFCDTCGSRLPRTGGPIVPVPAGLLDDHIEITPQINMHVASKPHWALVDHSIQSIEGQGSNEFWTEFMPSVQ